MKLWNNKSVWKLKDFYATLISREIKFGNFWVSKSATMTFLVTQIWKIWEFYTFKVWNCNKNQNSEPQKWPKLKFLSP